MTEICCGQSRPPLRLDFVTMAVVELGTVRGTGVGGGGGERDEDALFRALRRGGGRGGVQVLPLEECFVQYVCRCALCEARNCTFCCCRLQTRQVRQLFGDGGGFCSSVSVASIWLFSFSSKVRLLSRCHWTKPSTGATICPGFVFGWVTVRLKISIFSFFSSFSYSLCEPVWPSDKALCW